MEAAAAIAITPAVAILFIKAGVLTRSLRKKAGRIGNSCPCLEAVF
jgi:hypothetical protein